jgi:hypothetical protein
MNQYFARGTSSGGRSSSSSRSSSRSTSSSRSSTSSKSSAKSTASKPVSGKSTAKPGSTIKTASGKTVTSSAKKPTNAKYSRSTGVVGDNGYTPRFSGYSAPAGSVVYYPQHSALDYLPWIYLFSQSSPSRDQATVVQPDNKEVKAQPAGGFDGMILFNWIVFILIIAAIIAGIVYLVNKLTNKPKPQAGFSY